MSEHAARLAAHDEKFREADRMRDFGELPDDGTYQGIVERFDFFEAKSTGALYLKTEVKLTGPGQDAAGWEVEMIHDLDDPEKFGFLKTHLHRLGRAEVDEPGFKLSELETVHLPALLDTPVEIDIYTYERKDGSGTGRGARVNKALGPPMRQGAAAAAAQSDVPADTAGLAAVPPPTATPDDSVPF